MNRQLLLAGFVPTFTSQLHGLSGQIRDVLILGLLTCGILIVSAPTRWRAIGLLAVQSTALAGIALVLAVGSGTRGAYLTVALTLIAKVILIPLVLLRVARAMDTADDAEMCIGVRIATSIAVGVVAITFGLLQPKAAGGTLITSPYLPATVALVLTGGLIVVVRRHPLIQAIGLIVAENGIYLATMATANGLTPVVELGNAFDVFATVVLLGSIAMRALRLPG